MRLDFCSSNTMGFVPRNMEDLLRLAHCRVSWFHWLCFIGQTQPLGTKLFEPLTLMTIFWIFCFKTRVRVNVFFLVAYLLDIFSVFQPNLLTY